jgi:hypothetical protein
MAETASGQSTPATGQSNAAQGISGRFHLAKWVVLGSFLTIFLLVGALLGIAQLDNKDAAAVADKVFNTILPVLAGWMGTVLAFYFSAQSLETTSSSLRDATQAISHPGKSAAAGTTVSEKMIPTTSILKRFDLKGNPPATIELAEVEKSFGKAADGNVTITRLVFTDNGVFRYVLHIGTFNAFRVAMADQNKPLSELKLSDMLANPEYLRQISKLVVFVSASATLVEAKTALDAVAGAQDVIVTGTGNASGPMLGWLTNIDLAKALTVS